MSRPTVQELHRRIVEHLDHYGNSDASNLLWAGYLASLLEWNLLEIEDYDALRSLLKEVAADELRTVFLGVSGNTENEE